MVETSQYSAPIILLIEFSLALLLALYLLYKYANLRKQNPLVTGCTLLVWFLSFVIISLLPVDVSSVSQYAVPLTDTLSLPLEALGVCFCLESHLSIAALGDHYRHVSVQCP